MKKVIMKLLGAKYMLDGRYYWKLSTAKAHADNSTHRQIVWTLDYAKVYDTKSRWDYYHPDMANFNPYQ